MLEHRLLERARFQQMRTDQTIICLMRLVLAKRHEPTLSRATRISQLYPGFSCFLLTPHVTEPVSGRAFARAVGSCGLSADRQFYRATDGSPQINRYASSADFPKESMSKDWRSVGMGAIRSVSMSTESKSTKS
jgi:hypothetical protein